MAAATASTPSSRPPGRGAGKGQLGQAIVETAMLAPVMITLLLAILDVGRVMYYYIAVSNAAQAGAAYASYNPAHADPAWISYIVLHEAGPALTSANTTIDGPVTLTSGGMQLKQVTVTYRFSPIVPFPHQMTIPVSARATAPVAALG